MTKRSVSVLATIGIGLGLMGSFATGCSLGSGGTVSLDETDSIPDEHQDLIVPASDEGLSGEELWDRLETGGADSR